MTGATRATRASFDFCFLKTPSQGNFSFVTQPVSVGLDFMTNHIKSAFSFPSRHTFPRHHRSDTRAWCSRCPRSRGGRSPPPPRRRRLERRRARAGAERLSGDRRKPRPEAKGGRPRHFPRRARALGTSPARTRPRAPGLRTRSAWSGTIRARPGGPRRPRRRRPGGSRCCAS